LIRKMRTFVKREKPDAVVAFMAPICLIAGLACRGLKTRLITSERIDPAVDPRGTLFKAVLNNVYAHSSATVLQTQRAKRYFSERIQKNSVVIPNPIQVKVYAQGAGSHRIATAGRLVPQKNHRLLIEAFAKVHAVHSEYCLDIYGEGPLREELQALIDSLQLRESVTLKGNVPDLHEQIADAEMFVLSSDFEGLSNALLEAMMMGLPVVSTNCAGSDEAIVSEQNGLLVPVGDGEALKDAMLRLAEDAAFAARLGEAARKDAEERYGVKNVIGQWNAVIADAE
jgi:glycosyltransferase involved in cell wall biosynthesis